MVWGAVSLPQQQSCGIDSNGACAALVICFVTLIEMAGFTYALPDTAFTLLDSCIWSVDIGYQASDVIRCR